MRWNYDGDEIKPDIKSAAQNKDGIKNGSEMEIREIETQKLVVVCQQTMRWN